MEGNETLSFCWSIDPIPPGLRSMWGNFDNYGDIEKFLVLSMLNPELQGAKNLLQNLKNLSIPT